MGERDAAMQKRQSHARTQSKNPNARTRMQDAWGGISEPRRNARKSTTKTPMRGEHGATKAEQQRMPDQKLQLPTPRPRENASTPSLSLPWGEHTSRTPLTGRQCKKDGTRMIHTGSPMGNMACVRNYMTYNAGTQEWTC